MRELITKGINRMGRQGSKKAVLEEQRVKEQRKEREEGDMWKEREGEGDMGGERERETSRGSARGHHSDKKEGPI
jgi:hypothetical protein